MPDQPSWPTVDELEKLPLRAIVAYAARFARRAQRSSRARLDGHGQTGTIGTGDWALSVVEDFCTGTTDLAVAHHAVNVAFTATVADGTYGAAYRAAIGTVYAAGLATGKVPAHAADGTDNAARVAHSVASAAASTACCFAFAARDTDPAAFETAAEVGRADYDRLVQLELGVFPDLGKPIDPTENGPLGSLWLHGASKGFTESAGNKPQSAAEIPGDSERDATEDRTK